MNREQVLKQLVQSEAEKSPSKEGLELSLRGRGLLTFTNPKYVEVFASLSAREQASLANVAKDYYVSPLRYSSYITRLAIYMLVEEEIKSDVSVREATRRVAERLSIDTNYVYTRYYALKKEFGDTAGIMQELKSLIGGSV